MLQMMGFRRRCLQLFITHKEMWRSPGLGRLMVTVLEAQVPHPKFGSIRKLWHWEEKGRTHRI